MFLFISVVSLVILFLVNFIAARKGFYGRFSWFDKVMHFLGGFFVAMFWSGLIQSPWLIISLTLLVGVAWEIWEYVRKHIGEMRDTIEDLFFDILGAVVWVLAIGILSVY